jgi:NADH-quinone oxidoreductase subunit N
MLVAPALNYSLLSPMLIILGGALVAVLIEAFVGRARRAAIQLTITIGSISLSLLQLFGDSR